MKKLFISIFTAVFALFALGTATFAWFSVNDTVTASTMQVKAVVDANLYIAKGASVAIDAITGTSVADLNVASQAVKPADMSASAGTVTVRVPATYSTSPDVAVAGAGATWTTVGTVTATAATDEASYDLDNYAAYAYVTIARKQTTAASYKLTASCTVTAANASNLNKALRAGVVINGNFYESNDANSDGASAITFTFSDITGLTDNVAYSAALLLWFEGEDSDCYVNNAIVLSNNSAVWSFTSANE